MAESLIIDNEVVLWHHFDDPEDPELVVLAAHYSLHELAIEDCNSPTSRPKLDDYGEYIFVILDAPGFNLEGANIAPEKLCVFVSDNFIVTVCTGINKAVEYVRSAAQKRQFKSCKEIFYALTDHVCDRFLPSIDAISEEISELELKVYEKPDMAISKRAAAMKKMLTVLRRLAVSHREVINQLLRKHPPFVDPRLNLYFRDIYDHLIQATDLIETNRDLLTGIIDINLSITAHRTNEIVKTLTIYATVLLPLNVVTGYFGMNFQSLPLIREQWGVPLVTVVLLLMIAGTSVYFRKRQW